MKYLHFDSQSSSKALNDFSDLVHTRSNCSKTDFLVEGIRDDDVKRRSDQFDLDGTLLRAHFFTLQEGGFDSINPVVTETCHLDVGADLGGLGCESTGNLSQEGREDLGIWHVKTGKHAIRLSDA